jgi:hypothetical protein
MLVGRKRARSLSRPYTTGELNKMVDALLHPLAERSPELLMLDGILHGIIERNPPESAAKFIQHNLPKLLTHLTRSRRRQMMSPAR